MKRFLSTVPALLLAALTLSSVGCESTYYAAWEKLGYEKRDILSERVEEARDDQEEAKEQFADALEQFQSVVKVDGGELETKYNKLKDELADSEAIAEDVRERIASVEDVAEDLFAEWEKELDEYSDPKLKQSSAAQLRDTKQRYAKLLAAMKKAESKMEPVLKVFRDQVLFLKHNLNARAIASLQSTVVELESDVEALIADMNKSIAEADAFIKSIQ